ncbi:unnamed protein product [Urochloa humidicola]
MSEDELRTTVIKLLRERRGGRRCGGTASQGPNSSNTSESLKTAGVGMVMFGTVWQYIDKTNELVKEQVMLHLVLGQLDEEKKAREKEREAYALKAVQDASSPWWKQFWFRRD